jgi:hypothetical protein
MRKLFLLLLLVATLPVVQAQVRFDDAEVWVNRSRARIELEDLENFGTNTTGKLRVVLYGTEDDWDDTSHREAIAYFPVSKLRAGEWRSRLRKTVRVHRPDDWGWYWLTLTVQERVRDENGRYRWIIRDFVEFDSRIYFPPRARDIFWPF